MKLGLALGGGGARGAAHIGFLMALRELGVWPDLITGTSAGAIIGALVAAGMDLAAIAAFWTEINLPQLFSLPGSKPAFTDNVKAEALIESAIGRPTFADLKIPLAVVAVDLVHRQEVVLDEGDVISAVLASAAYPILAPPVQRNGMLLIDGGVLNNVPFDVARARGATYVLAIDLSNTAPYGTVVEPSASAPGLLGKALTATQRRPIWQVASAVSDILTTQGVRARMAISPPDLLVRPNVGTLGLFDFHRTGEGVDAGKKAAQNASETLQKLVAKVTAHDKLQQTENKLPGERSNA
ncbi:MAG: patatin-like phospholipase family protein [Anaerolineales bacterium]|nr:patatin-like phospholipase family protein [Anaerolineales bacterium]MCB8950630.1 patatin-like phospholipase family protein [Ardenticatenales bacterium]